MRILSIDLPWSADDRIFGFAAARVVGPAAVEGLDVRAVAGRGRDQRELFEEYAGEHGRFDLILLDHPIGGGPSPKSKAYRAVEHAFANAYFATNPTNNKRIQMPRFQPGAVHAADGLRIGAILREVLGTPASVVVESFPQLSIGALLEYAGDIGVDMAAIERLKTHKDTPWDKAVRAQQVYEETISRFLRQRIRIDAANGREAADAVDALLALVVGVVAAGYRPPDGEGERPWSRAFWLLSEPEGMPPHPSEVRAKARGESRSQWAAPLTEGVIESGVGARGILTLGLPGWVAPRHAPLGL